MKNVPVTFEPDPSVHNDPETLRLCPDIAKKCPVCNPKPALAPAGGVVYQLGGVWGPDVKKSTSPAPEDLMLVPRSYEEKFGGKVHEGSRAVHDLYVARRKAEKK
jgi:hypothetical protein